jgi:hypothetical protein
METLALPCALVPRVNTMDYLFDVRAPNSKASLVIWTRPGRSNFEEQRFAAVFIFARDKDPWLHHAVAN